jgi:hypothetical protein
MLLSESMGGIEEKELCNLKNAMAFFMNSLAGTYRLKAGRLR